MISIKGFKTSVLFIVIISAFAIILTECGGGGGSNGNVSLVSISVEPFNPSIANAATQQFTATGTYSDNTTIDITSSVTWSLSNTGIATISNYGLATAIAAGSTTITATSGSISGSTTLTVLVVHMLSIDQFGQGTIIDDLSGIYCESDCSEQYADGTTVTLTAIAASGWEFHHWIGCDTTNGNSGTVTMTSDKTIYATFNTIDTTIKAEVKELDDATMALLKEQAGTTLIFDYMATNVATLNPGDVIISNSGDGLARKVKSVYPLAGSSIFVETSNVTLEDIINEGTIVYNKQLTIDDLKSSQALLKGARLVRKANAPNIEFTIAIDSTVGPLNIDGSATLTFEPDFAVSVNWLKGITEFKSAMHITDSTNLTLSSSTSVPLISEEISLYKFYFLPVIVGPVVLAPVIEIKLSINGEAEVELTTSATYSEVIAIGVHYTKSEGWRSIHDYSKSFQAQEPTLTGSVSLKGGVGVETSILIYTIAGPYANFGAYLEAEAKETVSASQQCIEWALYMGIEANVGAEVKILCWSLARFEVNIFDYRWILKSATSHCEDNDLPFVPQNPIATSISSSEIQLTWDKSTDNIMVNKYLIYRDGNQISEALTNSFNDTRLSSSTTYCYSVLAVDTSGNRSTNSTTICAKTKPDSDTTPPTTPANLAASALSTSAVQLIWNASSDDTAVVGYKIYRDSAPVISVADLTANDVGLKRSTMYCYTVSAYDEAGNESEQSTSVCVITKSTGAWDVYIKCQEQSYQVEFNLDLDEYVTTNILYTGTGYDYNGTPLAFILTGIYNRDSSLFHGQITWSFEGSSCIRIDEFDVNLGSGDTGDVTMDQTAVCGCTTQIRFVIAGSGPLMNPSINKPSSYINRFNNY